MYTVNGGVGRSLVWSKAKLPRVIRHVVTSFVLWMVVAVVTCFQMEEKAEMTGRKKEKDESERRPYTHIL